MFPTAKAIAARRCNFVDRLIVVITSALHSGQSARGTIVELVDHAFGHHHTDHRSRYE